MLSLSLFRLAAGFAARLLSPPFFIYARHFSCRRRRPPRCEADILPLMLPDLSLMPLPRRLSPFSTRPCFRLARLRNGSRGKRRVRRVTHNRGETAEAAGAHARRR